MHPIANLYVHIPFCKHKCGYCDFNAYAGMDRLMPDYVAALETELPPRELLERLLMPLQLLGERPDRGVARLDHR